MVDKALSVGQGDTLTVERMLDGIRRGTKMLWTMHEGEDIQAVIVITTPTTSNGVKVWIELLAGAGIDDWGDELEQKLVDYRDEIGAYCIEASCRRGLARYLGRRPRWQEKAVIMEIPNGR